jgi:hypothetical protein
LDGKALERADVIAVHDIHRAVNFHSSIRIVYLDFSAPVVDTTLVAMTNFQYPNKFKYPIFNLSNWLLAIGNCEPRLVGASWEIV